MRATIQQEWDKQKTQISAEHGAAIQDIDRSKEVLTREVKECLVEARERIKKLREELNHARSINGDIIKLHDKAEALIYLIVMLIIGLIMLFLFINQFDEGVFPYGNG
ncbi:hypothetical protein Sps_00289 [Shewanella psychrophila]|uniref:Uncharacterized protein n=1 Tax=Shewanella psychrophila TaxID=225848 RepID=A0A1S6HJ26_9GAMM|nr:hypothetical protein [Shewanella psychrophila]AQS35509.1 hypothetical protein Sps_00289 [Shewanella psychrophila]